MSPKCGRTYRYQNWLTLWRLKENQVPYQSTRITDLGYTLDYNRHSDTAGEYKLSSSGNSIIDETIEETILSRVLLRVNALGTKNWLGLMWAAVKCWRTNLTNTQKYSNSAHYTKKQAGEIGSTCPKRSGI